MKLINNLPRFKRVRKKDIQMDGRESSETYTDNEIIKVSTIKGYLQGSIFSPLMWSMPKLFKADIDRQEYSLDCLNKICRDSMRHFSKWSWDCKSLGYGSGLEDKS